MPELIWYKRYPQDWISDPALGRCNPAARGVWADIVEYLYLSQSPTLSGPTDELSRLCRCSQNEFLLSVKELQEKCVGRFEYAEGMHKISCRRLLRECEMKELKRKAANARWSKDDAPHQKLNHARSASASASVSASVSDPDQEGESEGKVYSVGSRVVLHLLNELSGSKFRESKTSLAPIDARLKEPGVSIEEVKKMVHRQVTLWKGTKMNNFLRPETLFGKEKFDGYYALRDQPINNEHPGNHKQTSAEYRNSFISGADDTMRRAEQDQRELEAGIVEVPWAKPKQKLH